MGAIGSAVLVGCTELICGTGCNALSSVWGILIGGGCSTGIYAICQPIGDELIKIMELMNRWLG